MSNLSKEVAFISSHGIGSEVSFKPHYEASLRFSKGEEVEPDYRPGTIVSVKFTKAKIWYDILDDLHGYLYHTIDSVYVKNKP